MDCDIPLRTLERLYNAQSQSANTPKSHLLPSAFANVDPPRQIYILAKILDAQETFQQVVQNMRHKLTKNEQIPNLLFIFSFCPVFCGIGSLDTSIEIEPLRHSMRNADRFQQAARQKIKIIACCTQSTKDLLIIVFPRL